MRLGLLILAVVSVVVLALGLTFTGVSDRGISAERVQARNDLIGIITALKSYYGEYGTMPSGDNAKIMAALRGKNPREIVFIQMPDNKMFNARGEFLDPWKTPYRIDASKPEFPWAYSCGKNRLDEGGQRGTDDICTWE